MTTAPMQPHINDEMALVLQNQGASLTHVAQNLFGYQIVHTFDESFIVHPLTQGFTSIAKNDKGLELLHTPFGGKKFTNAIDFVRDHDPSVKSTLAAVDYIRKGMGIGAKPAAA